MVDYLSTHQSFPKEEQNKEFYIKQSNSSIQLDLNPIVENEENIKNNEENLSEDECLGYNSKYKVHQNNYINKDGPSLKDSSYKRKASTVSTTLSQTDMCSEANNCFSPPKTFKSINFDRKVSNPQSSHVFFGRERLNSNTITNYFEGIDSYFLKLYPEKNNYKKSGNYIEKEKLFKKDNNYYKDYKYKSFDLSENKKFNSDKILKNLEENYNTSNENKINEIPSIENNKLNNNLNISYNPKFTNNIYGKFDMPMYYFGYYNFECK